MEKETTPDPIGMCEKIFKALSIGPAFHPIRRISNMSATPTDSIDTSAPTTTVYKRIEIEEAPSKHKQTSLPPPPPPPTLPENKVGTKVEAAQRLIQIQERERPAGEDKVPNKTIPDPPQEKLLPTQVKDKVVPVEPAALAVPKKENTPVKVEPPTIPAAPVPSQDKLQPTQVKEKVVPVAPAAPKKENTPVKEEAWTTPAVPTVRRPALPPAARPVARPAAKAPPLARPAAMVPPLTWPAAMAPPLARPAVVAPPATIKEREKRPVVANERGRVGARVEPPPALRRAMEKGPVPRVSTSRVEEYLARARNTIRTASDAGAAPQSGEPRTSQTK